ncbi:hypothetical protein TNCT_52671 [Trichonephila clavata]|uniref:Uncharacterized protein n=1 Tax=Trichonephila clavata TaxID=2740835 RepID=A0A8X6KNM3_TRICU|nr:hypothetical protein TNCT_52671 [Trichonephila clavata]
MLFGTHYFFEFLKSAGTKLKDGLILPSSCFGNLVSGAIPDDNSTISLNQCFLPKNLEDNKKTIETRSQLLCNKSHVAPMKIVTRIVSMSLS